MTTECRKKRNLYIIGGLIFSAVLALVGHSLFFDRLLPVTGVTHLDFGTFSLNSNPNQFLVCSPNLCTETPHMTSPVYSFPAETLAADWDDMINRQSNIELLFEDQPLNQRDYVQRTPLMRFPDIITVRFYRLPNGMSTLAIYSRAIYGKSDFGVNKARIESWLREIP